MIWAIAIFGGLFFALILGPVVGKYLFDLSKQRETAELNAWDAQLKRYLNSCSRIRVERDWRPSAAELNYYDELITRIESKAADNATDFVSEYHDVRNWN